MSEDDDTLGLVDLHEAHAPELYRLAVMLGADGHSRNVVRDALVALGRRSRRFVDPADQLEYLRERVVHESRTVRNFDGRGLELPSVPDPAQQRLLEALCRLPVNRAEALVVSHYLEVFGPELAGILRMTVRTTNQRLEDSLRLLSAELGRPGAGTDGMDTLSRELTTSLASAARLIESPDPEPLVRTLSVIRANEAPRVPVLVLVPLLLVSLVLGGWLGTMSVGARANQTQPVPVEPSSPQPSPQESRSLPTQVQAVPVYYVGRTDDKLYRELRDLAAGGGVLETAVQAVLTAAPLDPDYVSAWGPGEVLSVTLTNGEVVIDLSAEAYAGMTPTSAPLAAHQMVYTVTDVLGDPDLRVRFLSAGQPVSAAVLPSPAEGWGRAGLTPMPALWLSTPRNGAVLTAGAMIIAGTVQPGTQAPEVSVTDTEGREVANASAQTANVPNRDGWRTWSVNLQLPRGTYQVTAKTVRTVGGNTPEVSAETKTFTLE